MTRSVDVASAGVRAPLGRARVAEIVRAVLRSEGIANARISVTFLSGRGMAALNRRHLGRGGTTDVISFGFARARAGDPVVADLYIAPTVARENAATHGVSVREEVARLVVHGVLHALGFDHPEGAQRTASPMWRRQEALLQRLFRRAARRRRRKSSGARAA